jgi:tetratricopeptide (TPR) repeat protein
VLGYFGEDIKAAIGLMDRSLELNPSFAHGWRWSGWIRLYAGHADLAIEHFQKSLRLSPRDRTAGRLTGIGIAHFFSQRFDDAAAMLLVSLEELPAHATPYRFLASCYAHMGRLDEAREGRQAAPRRYPCCGAQCHALPKRRAARAIPIGPASSCWRDGNATSLTDDFDPQRRRGSTAN